MRPLLVLAALCLALTGPAAAQERSRFVIVQPQPKTATGLRGSLSAPSPATSPLAPAAPEVPAIPSPGDMGALAAPITWRRAPDGAAARQCRSACDRGYYFCLSAGDDDSCPTSWSQCRTRCEARNG